MAWLKIAATQSHGVIRTIRTASGGFYSTCTCGWRSPPAHALRIANIDSDAHLKSKRPTPTIWIMVRTGTHGFLDAHRSWSLHGDG